MHMQWYAVPVALLLCAVALSGCIITWDFETNTRETGPVTAKGTSNLGWHDRADTYREDWSLMAIYGVMGTPHGIDYPSSASPLTIKVDGKEPASNPATNPHGAQARDGKLEHWATLYYGDDPDRYLLSISSGTSGHGSGTDLFWMPRVLYDIAGQTPLDPTGDWIDSDRAMAIALEERPGAVSLLENKSADVLMLLHHVAHLDNPHWSILIVPHTGAEEMSFVIDAVTKSPLDPFEVYLGKEPVAGEGEITPSLVQATHPFSVNDDGHAMLSVAVTPEGGSLPYADVDATLRLPDTSSGLEVSMDLKGGWPEGLLGQVLAPREGPYELETSASTNVQGVPIPVGHEEVRVHWCLDGALPDPLGLHSRGACLPSS